MKCISCGAKTTPGTTTDVSDLLSYLIIIRHVPCNKCSECNEILYTADVVMQLETIASAAKTAVNEIAIVDYSIDVA